MLRTALALGLVLAAVGCNNSSSPPSAGSCTITNGGAMACTDFGAGYTTSIASAACNSGMGVYASGSACTSSGRSARCTVTVTNAGGTIQATINYYAPITATQAQGQCPPSMPAANTTYTFAAN
jgi:hypothetical protein